MSKTRKQYSSSEKVSILRERLLGSGLDASASDAKNIDILRF